MLCCMSTISVSPGRLRLAKMNEEMRESEGPYSHTGQYNSNSPTEMQYRKCMEEFISLQLGDS